MLNGGGALQLEMPTFSVQLPLSPDFWISLLLGDVDGASATAVEAGELPASLFARVAAGPDAARLHLALSALDAATLAFLDDSPRTLAALYGDRDRLEAFSRYGRSLRVRDGQVVVPGGAPAAPCWEAIVGASPADPARFLPRLAGSDRGQLAYFATSVRAAAALSNIRGPLAAAGRALRSHDGSSDERHEAVRTEHPVIARNESTPQPFRTAPVIRDGLRAPEAGRPLVAADAVPLRCPPGLRAR